MALNPNSYTFTVLDYTEESPYARGDALVLVEPPIETEYDPEGLAHANAMKEAAESTLILHGLASGGTKTLHSVKPKGDVEYAEDAGFDEETGVYVPGSTRRGTLVRVEGNPPKPETPPLALTTAEAVSEIAGSSAETALVEGADTPEDVQPGHLMPEFAVRAVRTFVSRVGETPVATRPTLASVR